ncbi:hypothetical protein HGRIS_014355 [Hohenbuehelia grisea]|uniref:Uncharacterized protein n=1 Tax=Hohenbuehelia grisea TaxID=104357 RepID=A0ABR3JUL3_9AGAR
MLTIIADADTAAAAILDQLTLPRLTNFIIGSTPNMNNSLTQFLRRNPSLSNLTIYSFRHWVNAPRVEVTGLSASHLPNLTFLAAPDTWIRALVPNSKISSVGIFWDLFNPFVEDIQRTYNALGQSRTPITTVSTSCRGWKPELVSRLMAYVPELQKLSIRNLDGDGSDPEGGHDISVSQLHARHIN